MACLVWDSPGGRKVFELDRAVMVAGRDPGSDVHLPDATVSRRHALLQVDGDRVRITDLGSTTKTRINGAALVRDVPSTLESGDFVHFGKLELTFHATPPPAPATPAPPSRAARPRPQKAAKPAPARRARAPKPGGAGPWKLVAVGLAFVVVALLGAFLALHGSEPEPPVIIADTPQPEPADRPESKPGPARDTEPKPEPKPEPGPAEEPAPEAVRAPAGALPPAGYAPLEDCPDLLEVDGRTYFAVALVSFDEGSVDVRGHDGRIYRLARREVTRILDRADLVRRIAVQRAGFASDDAESRLQLALWCADRYVPNEARQLVGEVMALRPGDEKARALHERLEGER